ncbi:hypothetical protein EJB05_42178, partial [Eragrostis curvula]
MEVSRVSCAHYRRKVYGDPEFITYVLPSAELRYLNIGSRPAKRKPAGVILCSRGRRRGWCCRLGWASASGCKTAMYAECPFFQSTVDLIEVAAVKADAPMAAHYEEMLVPEDSRGRGAAAGAGAHGGTRCVLVCLGYGWGKCYSRLTANTEEE